LVDTLSWFQRNPSLPFCLEEEYGKWRTAGILPYSSFFLIKTIPYNSNIFPKSGKKAYSKTN
jgi:hypothetical protein